MLKGKKGRYMKGAKVTKVEGRAEGGGREKYGERGERGEGMICYSGVKLSRGGGS